MRIGELFAGYGGLGAGVQQVLGGDIAWFSEFDAAPSKILAHHWPDTPNHGDITKIDWTQVEPVDILTGGFPCQDVSLAGARAGLTDTSRSGLWSEFARAIAALQPRMVVIENVRGLLSATASGSVEPDPWGVGDGATRPVINALGAVLGDLADLGYDAQWCGVRAADAGAPHGRFRVFILAHSANDGHERSGRARVGGSGLAGGGQPAADPSCNEPERRGGLGDMGSATPGNEGKGGQRERVRNTVSDRGATLADTGGKRGNEGDHTSGKRGESADGSGVADERGPRPGATKWGVYQPAIERWEQVTGFGAPAPTDQDWDGWTKKRASLLSRRTQSKMPIGMRGSLRSITRPPSHRLSARFVEWMMGLPAGHVTDPAMGLTRNEQLKALGNGVVPQQAALALSILATNETVPQ